MSKNKNVCLGRRGRPKKNQEKLKLSDFISALCETEYFSFFPLSKSYILDNDYNLNNINLDVKFNSIFKEWYTYLINKFNSESNIRLLNSDKNGSDNLVNESIKVKLNECNGELNCNEISVYLNKGIHTKSANIPYLMFINGHVWKMAFSPPLLLKSFDKNSKCGNLNTSIKAVYLSMSIHPLNNPLTQINKRYNEKGTIQIWEIPYIDYDNKETDSFNDELFSVDLSPTLKYEVQHNGLICRYMEWVPISNYNKTIIGILFCVLGDGNSYLLSVPYYETENPAVIDFNDLVIWKYSSVFTVISGSICIPSIDNNLKISGTTVEGALLIWTFENNNNKTDVSSSSSTFNIESSEQIIIVSKNIPLLCSCWCPIDSSYLISVCSSNGTISIIDFRNCNNHIIKEFELSNRPITSINWCRLTNNLLISHGIGAVMLSIENGDYTQFSIETFIKKRKYSIYDNLKYPILGSRSWTCDSLLHYAIFGFNDGSTVIGPCFEFESKSFQETLLIKTFVSTNSSTDSDETYKVDSNIDSDLFSNMKELITCNYNNRLDKIKSGTININLNHENSNECNLDI
ncbi:hypothetical protein RS030_81429, partial [Cryptosporidium xiaoi]